MSADLPALVATLAGLQAAGRLELELMKTYAAGDRKSTRLNSSH